MKDMDPLKMEMRNVQCGMRIEKEKPKIRNPQFEIRN